VNPVLAEAMNYAVVGGGKRVRAFLVTRACELCGGSAEESEPAAVAIECIHAFSLVHDDLPAMDDDDLRRGRPTCHRAFGEAVAILAGDGLNTLAFEILATQTKDPERAVAAVAELANATGWAGMIGGQTTDILSETKPTQLELVEEIHRYKTARLIECAARLGAIAAGASREQQEALGLYGRHLGLAFQIADDLLDVTGTQEQMGKSVSKDAGAGKQTYPAAVGMDASREMAGRVAQQAIDSLADFGTEADDLRHLVRFVIERKN
jgi:geranylgeranyl diphosphate synthase type II